MKTFELKLKFREQLLKDGWREFKKNDWYGLAGAERFQDGSEPVLKESEDEESMFVFDNSGLSIIGLDGEESLMFSE